MSSLKTPEACESLTDIRAGIDFFDRQILESLQQRLGYVKAAVRFKANEQAIPAPERVAAMLQDRREWAASGPSTLDSMWILWKNSTSTSFTGTSNSKFHIGKRFIRSEASKKPAKAPKAPPIQVHPPDRT